MTGETIVFVACPESSAELLSNALINENLAACVNILPKIKSIFLWHGKVCREDEALLIVKTNLGAWNVLESRIVELHPYEVPEILSVPIELGYKPYLDWLNSTVSLSIKSNAESAR